MNIMLEIVWGLLLQKYNNQNHVVFAKVVSGRPPEIEGIENMVGLFINTVPVRVTCSDAPGRADHRFEDLIRSMQQEAMESRKYEYVSLADIQAESELKQDLINNLMRFENYPIAENILKVARGNGEDFGISGVDIFDQTNYDLNLTITPGKEIEVLFNYNENKYSMETVKMISGHLLQTIRTVVGDPNIPVNRIEILTEEEKRKILMEFNDTKAEYPREKTIHRLFEEQVERTPDKIAVKFQDKSLTYGDLNNKANQLARKLRRIGIKNDSIVAVILDRSTEMIIAALGILKAGGAYLPVDPEYPQERIDFTLEDSGAQVLLTQKDLMDKIAFEGRTLALDDESAYETDRSNPETINRPQDLAYIIYTSGTTGRPKGVMVEHKNVVRLLFNERMQFDFNENDVWTMFHSFCFDFSVWEMYGALLYGGKLIVIPRIVAQEPEEYLKLLKREKVTVLNQTPTAFYHLIDEELRAQSDEAQLGVRYVIFGGEALKPVMLKDWKKKYPGIKLINMYGITETTVHVTYKEITDYEIKFNISNIGRPIPTLTTYITDE